MLNFFKQFFKEKQEPRLHTFTLDQLSDWFDKRSKQQLDKFSSVIDDYQKEFLTAKEDLSHALHELSQAQLQNENIPTKAISYMKGNKESYLRLVNQLIEQLTPPPTSVSHVQKWTNEFNEHLNAHLQSSQRNYQILSQFFARELEQVAKAMKTLEQQVKSIADYIKKQGLAEIDRVTQSTNQLKERVELKKKLEEQYKQEQQLFKGIEKQLLNASSELERFATSPEFVEQKNKQTEVEERKRDLKNHQSKLSSEFSSLDRALKKLTKVALDHEALIVEYQYRPEVAIMSDSKLNILDILETLKKSIESGGIILDDKKKQKSLAVISKLDRTFFEQYLGAYHRMHRELEQLSHLIETSDARKIHQDLLTKVENVERESTRLKRSLDECQSKVDQIALAQERDELQALVMGVTGEEVILKL